MPFAQRETRRVRLEHLDLRPVPQLDIFLEGVARGRAARPTRVPVSSESDSA